MRCLLDEGRVGDTPLLSAKTVREMGMPRAWMSRSEHAEIGDSHYGLGLFCENYRGDRTLAHSGSWFGWATLMTVVPSRRAGVAVLTNRAPGAVTSILTFAALDRIAGREPVDWFQRLLTKRRADLVQQRVDEKARTDRRRAGTQPSHALEEYAGRYEHPAYGCIEIAHEGDHLAWHWRGAAGALTHWHYDMFVTPDRPTVFHPDNLALSFLYDRAGRIDRIAVPFEPMVEDIVFRRAKDAPEA
ncbi:MAG: hypothetical protein GAK39_01922 [Variovorax sp.]|nr:MAG: hypothetical protein GAK39_01922 [Variovorax sp.]